ncbi:hypothetical protein GCM10018987_02010 [Streptomyces cremeus]
MSGILGPARVPEPGGARGGRPRHGDVSPQTAVPSLRGSAHPGSPWVPHTVETLRVPADRRPMRSGQAGHVRVAQVPPSGNDRGGRASSLVKRLS